MLYLKTKEIILTPLGGEVIGNFINELLDFRNSIDISLNRCIVVGVFNDRRIVVDKDTTHSQCFDQFEAYDKQI